MDFVLCHLTLTQYTVRKYNTTLYWWVSTRCIHAMRCLCVYAKHILVCGSGVFWQHDMKRFQFALCFAAWAAKIHLRQRSLVCHVNKGNVSMNSLVNNYTDNHNAFDEVHFKNISMGNCILCLIELMLWINLKSMFMRHLTGFVLFAKQLRIVKCFQPLRRHPFRFAVTNTMLHSFNLSKSIIPWLQWQSKKNE